MNSNGALCRRAGNSESKGWTSANSTHSWPLLVRRRLVCLSEVNFVAAAGGVVGAGGAVV